MATLEELKTELYDYVRLSLGAGMIDVELDNAHCETAYKKALRQYRQRASNAYEESYTVLELVEGQNTYILPQEVTHVRQIFRRTMGNATGPYSSSFDPFSSASLNVYLLNYNANGGLATYDFYTQYVELSARMFGGYINFTFNPVTKRLVMVRNPKGTGEPVLLWTYNLKPEVVLLQDQMIQPWIFDYTAAAAKYMLGEAREKFGTIAGPQGGGSLNGSALKAEGASELERLTKDLENYVDGSTPITFVIG